MIDIKIPCSIGSVLRDNEDKKEYIVIKYEIRGHFNLLFAMLSDVNNESSMDYMILIKDGQLPNGFEIIDDLKVKENKIMGLTSKQVGKFQSIMRKMENQLEVERKAAKEKKDAKKSKANISKQ